jgi:hypothetical protein
MKSQYRLKQIVIVTERRIETGNKNDNILNTPIDNTLFFGEIAAINNESQLCIRRFNFNIPLGTDITELQWINLKTENYSVMPITLAPSQPNILATQKM